MVDNVRDEPPRDLVTLNAVARLAGCSLRSAHRWRTKERFRSWRRRGRCYASREEVLAFLAERRQALQAHGRTP